MEFQNYYGQLNFSTICGSWYNLSKFMNIQNVEDWILELLLETGCPHNVCMVVQHWKFIKIPNITDGILEIVLEIECLNNLFMVVHPGNSYQYKM